MKKSLFILILSSLSIGINGAQSQPLAALSEEEQILAEIDGFYNFPMQQVELLKKAIKKGHDVSQWKFADKNQIEYENRMIWNEQLSQEFICKERIRHRRMYGKTAFALAYQLKDRSFFCYLLQHGFKPDVKKLTKDSVPVFYFLNPSAWRPRDSEKDNESDFSFLIYRLMKSSGMKSNEAHELYIYHHNCFFIYPKLFLAHILAGINPSALVDNAGNTSLINLVSQVYPVVAKQVLSKVDYDKLDTFINLSSLLIKLRVPLDHIAQNLEGLIRTGRYRSQISKHTLQDLNGKTFEQIIKEMRTKIKGHGPKSVMKDAIQVFDQAKQEVAVTQAETENLLSQSIATKPLVSIIKQYLNDDVICSSVAQELAALQQEFDLKLRDCKQFHKDMEQEEKERKERLEAQGKVSLHLDSLKMPSAERIEDMNLDHSFDWDNYYKDQEMQLDSNDRVSQNSSSHYGLNSICGLSFDDDMELSSIQSSSGKGLSNANGSSSSHNRSQSSSSNANWMRANSAPQSSSSHNGLPNSSNNGLQAMRDDASHSSSLSDAPHGKGEKRKLDDEEDNRDGAKRARTENGNSNNSNPNGSK